MDLATTRPLERSGWGCALIPLLIACITFAAFLPTLQNGFVKWDDHQNLLNNPHYRGLGWNQLRWILTTFHMGHYIPLTWMTFGVDYLLWGMNPVGYHLTSLLLHVANAVVVYFLAGRILGLALPGFVQPGKAGLYVPAGLAALLFAVHPLRVESVAWATERRDVLSALFYLLAILTYLRACERAEPARRWYWTSVGLFVGALASKSMAVSLPVILLILDVYPLKRLGGTSGWWNPHARRIYFEKIPFVLAALAASTLAFLAVFRLPNMPSLHELGMPGRFAISAHGLSFYLWKTAVPVNLSPLYLLPVQVNPGALPFILAYGVVLALTALALALRRRVPGLLAVWLAYVAILLPVLGIFQNGPQIAADRYTYLAGLGWVMLAGAGWLSWWRARGVLVGGLAVCVAVGLGALTWNQVQVWRDSETLWTHALSVDPRSPFAHNNLGSVIADQGRMVEAIEHYRHVLNLKPDYAGPGDYARAHHNWGVMLARLRRPAEAIAHYQEALRIRPNYAQAHHNLGMALAQQGQFAEAIVHYRQAVRIKPDFAESHNHLGFALAQQGQFAEAIVHYRQAVRIKPDFADAHNNWGVALAQQGRLAEALERFRQAVTIRPTFTEAHVNLRKALAGQGRQKEAGEYRDNPQQD